MQGYHDDQLRNSNVWASWEALWARRAVPVTEQDITTPGGLVNNSKLVLN